jgi:SAM-dependent methyltransferase
MRSTVFSEKYAELYDLIHAEKNYASEVQNIVKVLDISTFNSLRGFDFGCGTGAHASEFYKLGILVDGYDISQDMLDVAKKKNHELKFSNNLKDFATEYDFTYSLFDVLSYQISEQDALKLLSALFARTKPGGVALVDSWNADGVFRDPPKVNERVVRTKGQDVIRRVTPDLNSSDSGLYRLEIDLLLGDSKNVVRSEIHVIKAWAPTQIMEMMSELGFADLELFSLKNPGHQFNELDWRFGIKARKS